MKNKVKAIKGITLVALVVTVIVLMILAGITLSLVLGQKGLIIKAQQAGQVSHQATADEDLKMMLGEYYTNKSTGDTETLIDYLNRQKAAGKIDSVQANESNYDVTLEGYICTVDSNTLDIINITKDVGPQVSNIKIVANSDGTGDNLGKSSTVPGTTLYITFTAAMPDGSNVTVSPSIPYAVTQNGTYNFTITGNVAGNDKTKTISVTVNQFSIQAKVGDFINYDAGTWTQDIITSLGSLYSGASLPTRSNPYTFGGFNLGDSKNSSITTISNDYGTFTNKYSSGWRVLSVNGDGSIQNIVQAGTPEAYYFTNDYSVELNTLTTTRKWDMYVNSQYATSAHCMTYNDANTTSADVRTTGSLYCLATAFDSYHLWSVFSDGSISYARDECFGIRPVVTMKLGIQIIGGSGTWADPYQMK